jgi:hypothetical protein
MRTSIPIALALASLALAACGRHESLAALRQEPALPRNATPFTLALAVELPRVTGRLDHVAYDPTRDRAWIAARENDTIEIVDLARGKHARSLAGYEEPQGIAYLPELDRVVVACGASGTLEALDADTGESIASVAIGRDADVVRWDAASERVFVGWGTGSISVIDARAWKVVSAFALTSHPEGFALAPDGERLFVNLADERKVVAVSRSEKRLENAWNLAPRRGNYPMVLLSGSTRLAVGVREPAALVTLDSTTGAVLGSEPLSGDVDDLFEDAENRRIYASCGEGWIDVFEPRPDGNWRRTARHATRKGARTALWVASTRRLLVALPSTPSQSAELWVLALAP